VLGHERLAAEPRLDRHDQQQVDPLVQVRFHRLERRRPVDHDPGPHAQLADPGEQRAGVAELHVHAAQVGPRLSKLLEPHAGVGDHEMTVQEQVGVPSDRGHHRRPDRQVRHEVSVHQVDVQPVGLGTDGGDLLGQHRVVGGQDRRREQDVVRHGRSVPQPAPRPPMPRRNRPKV
jgi:hypothetical protein